MNKRSFTLTSIVSVAAVATGCANSLGDTEATAPEAAVDTTEGEQLITSVNGDGTWTANSQFPGVNNAYVPPLVRAITTFTGPAGKTRKMGNCALVRYSNQFGQAVYCNSVSDCGSAPASLPAGGFRYCTAPNGVGNKMCFYRPGSQANYCAGTPANGGIPIAAATLYSPWMQAFDGGHWISYGCFEGCTATDPSSSSSVKVVDN